MPCHSVAALFPHLGIASTSHRNSVMPRFLFGRVADVPDSRNYITLIPDNMEQIKAHIAVSLDGHTATPDYELDWMPREVKELAAREHAAASCLLMGANTYNYIFEHWGGWPHKSKRSLWCHTTTPT